MRSPTRAAVRRLAIARVISISGGGAAFTALNFTIYARTHSAAWLAATLLMTFGVSGFITPFAGALGDRFDRRRVMIASDLAGAGCFLAMAFVSSPAGLISVAFLAAIAESPFWPASGAAIPNLAGPSELTWANSLLSMSRYGGIVIGPALGGTLLSLIGAPWVFAVNGISFVVSAALVVTVRGRFSGARAEEDAEHAGRITAGVPVDVPAPGPSASGPADRSSARSSLGGCPNAPRVDGSWSPPSASRWWGSGSRSLPPSGSSWR